MALAARECFEQGTLEILVIKPGFTLTDDNLEDLLQAANRKALFFDENVPVFVVLHLATRATDQDAFDIAQRTSLTLEAYVSDSNARAANAPPLVRQDSFSTRQNRQEQGQVVHSKSLDSASPKQISQYRDHHVIVWRHATFLPFTSTKSALSRVSFSVNLTLNEYNSATGPSEADSYIEASDVLGRDKNYNLLAALENDVFLKDAPPKLTAARISTMASVIDTTTRKPKKSGKRYFPIFSAISLQIRSFNFPATTRILLSLDLESSDPARCSIDIEAIDIEHSLGTSSPLVKYALPIHLKPVDLFTYGFDLDLKDCSSETGTDIDILVKIASRPLTHDVDGPKLLSQWNTAVHLPPITNRMLPQGSAVTRPQQVHRSSSNLLLRPLSGPLSPREPVTVNTLAGVSLIITAPDMVEVGQIINVPILLKNNGTSTKNLNIDVSRRRKELPRPPPPAPHELVSVEKNFLSDEDMLILHQRHTTEPIDLICLTNSIKVGILAPDSQVEVSLQYLALKRGLVALQDLRVVEIGSGTFQELKDLPEIYIH